MTVVSVEACHPFPSSLSPSRSLSERIFLHFILVSIHSFSHHTTLLFALCSFLCLSHRIYCNWLYMPSLPPSPPNFLPLSFCFLLQSGSAATLQSSRWLVGWANGCNTGHGSCLSSPLVSCVAASGTTCLSSTCVSSLPSMMDWTAGIDGLKQPWTRWPRPSL